MPRTPTTVNQQSPQTANTHEARGVECGMMPTAALSLVLSQGPSDAKIVDLKDGFVRVETPSYTIEVPKGGS